MISLIFGELKTTVHSSCHYR